MNTFSLILSLVLAPCAFSATEVAYGPHEAQKMDIYLPDDPENASVMFYVHGGGWKRGDKARTGAKVDYFTSKGWIFVSANYRLIPEGKHPNNVQDLATAIAWVHENIQAQGGNPEAIHIMGHSAGAHLVALVGTDDRYLKKTGKKLSVIKSVTPLDIQAYDIPDLMGDRAPDLYKQVFSEDPEVWKEASPITHVSKDKNIPPFLISYSRGSSRFVNPGRSRRAHDFAKALRSAGGNAIVVDASDRDHGEINRWFGADNDKIVTPAWERFIDALGDSRK